MQTPYFFYALHFFLLLFLIKCATIISENTNMSKQKRNIAHEHTRALRYQLSHFVASVSFTVGILVIGLVGTWIVRTVLTESRASHQAGRVAGASIETTPEQREGSAVVLQQLNRNFPLRLGKTQFLLRITY